MGEMNLYAIYPRPNTSIKNKENGVSLFTRRLINNKASPRVAGRYNIFKKRKGFYVLEWQ